MLKLRNAEYILRKKKVYLCNQQLYNGVILHCGRKNVALLRYLLLCLVALM